jgi:hypothetical protein
MRVFPVAKTVPVAAILAAGLLAVACWPASLSAQTPAQGAARNPANGAIPRTSDGKPNLTGVWQGGNNRRGTWDEANSGLGVGGTGRDLAAPANLGSQQVVNEPAPYQPWAARKVLESFNRRGIDDPAALCLPPGLPRLAITGLFPQQIIQTPQQIVILYEYMNVFRVIPLNARHHDDLVPTYLGDSVGHWEGDTLVVDVIGFNDKTWLTGTGTFHSEALHLTERYTRLDKDQINYDVTIEDPTVLTRPWTVHSTIMLREGTRVQEYICAENNLDPGRYEQLLKAGIKLER